MDQTFPVQVFIDFDGTITTSDSVSILIERFAEEGWQEDEGLWDLGRISSKEYYARQFKRLKISKAELEAFLQGVPIDQWFGPFVAFAKRYGLPLAIVSDGFTPFIEAILAHHEIGGLPIFANGLSIRENPKTGLLTLLPKPKLMKLQACKVQAALCKCDVVEPLVARAQTSVYIGNGRSDFCVSQHVNGLILFAKDELAGNLEAKGARFFPFQSFRDVMEVLSGLMVQAAGGNIYQTIEGRA